MYAHEIGVPQCARQVGLAVEAGAVVGVSGNVGGKHFQGIVTRQPRMLGKVRSPIPPEPSRRTMR